MPTTKLVTLYTYEELSDDAKSKARDWYREASIHDDFWSEHVIEEAETFGKMLGIEFKPWAVKLMSGATRYKPTILYSGFWSQGDGACFEGNYYYAKGAAKAISDYTGGTEHKLIDIAKRLQSVQRKAFYQLGAKMTHTGYYMHSGCMTVDVHNVEDSYKALPEGAEEELIDCMRDFADWIYRTLESEYEYQNSDESVEESILANEYTFTEDGERED